MRISDWSSDVCSSDLGRRLFLLGSDHHDHLPAFQARARFDHDVFAEVCLDPGSHFATEFLVAHLAAAEADVDLELVAHFQELAHLAQLDLVVAFIGDRARSEEHTSELQSLMRISYAVFCLKKKIKKKLANIDQ